MLAQTRDNIFSDAATAGSWRLCKTKNKVASVYFEEVNKRSMAIVSEPRGPELSM